MYLQLAALWEMSQDGAVVVNLLNKMMKFATQIGVQNFSFANKINRMVLGFSIVLGWAFAGYSQNAGFAANNKSSASNELTRLSEAKILHAGFVCVEKVYNSELMAPYDILQHSYYRDPQSYIRCFIVTPDGKPFVTSEGIHITPDYSFSNAPPIDILVIPSTETSMTKDLKNAALMAWLKNAVAKASHVITLCDGAFPLAATGVLDGRVATTFPADRKELAARFPKIKVRDDVNFAVSGKYLTSVGGALSYEPALYLLEKIYSTEHAQRTGVGLVLDWDLRKVPHVIE